MARMVRGSGPVSRDAGGYWATREEHDAWVREHCARIGVDPAPCDCGFWSDGWLVSCYDRAECKRLCAKRLDHHHRHAHEKALAKKRAFPGLGPTPSRCCKWCKQPIVHGRVGQRSMHDGRLDEPRCRWMHDLHIHLATQQSYLLNRDGLGCVGCGAIMGGWGRVWVCQEHRAAERGVEGETHFVRWFTSLEVDHFVPLGLAWEAFAEDDRRRWFFSPANLRLLCPGCHKAKTVDDRAAIRAAYDLGPEWAKAEVLRRLREARLIASARSKGAP